jgi:hypothetical protein
LAATETKWTASAAVVDGVLLSQLSETAGRVGAGARDQASPTDTAALAKRCTDFLTSTAKIEVTPRFAVLASDRVCTRADPDSCTVFTRRSGLAFQGGAAAADAFRTVGAWHTDHAVKRHDTELLGQHFVRATPSRRDRAAVYRDSTGFSWLSCKKRRPATGVGRVINGALEFIHIPADQRSDKRRPARGTDVSRFTAIGQLSGSAADIARIAVDRASDEVGAFAKPQAVARSIITLGAGVFAERRAAATWIGHGVSTLDTKRRIRTGETAISADSAAGANCARQQLASFALVATDGAEATNRAGPVACNDTATARATRRSWCKLSACEGQSIAAAALVPLFELALEHGGHIWLRVGVDLKVGLCVGVGSSILHVLDGICRDVVHCGDIPCAKLWGTESSEARLSGLALRIDDTGRGSYYGGVVRAACQERGRETDAGEGSKEGRLVHL